MFDNYLLVPNVGAAFFVLLGLGIACLWLQSPVAFATVGIASIIAAIARLLSRFIDRSFSIKNIGGVFTWGEF